MRRRGSLAALLALALVALGAARAEAQAPALDAARAQLENIKPDSTFVLLSSWTPPRGTVLETRYWTLLGFVQLLRGHEDEAQRAFRNALDTDASLNIDSLTYLQSDAARVFAAARNDLRRSLGTPLPVIVTVAADTVLTPFQGRLPIEVRPHLRSMVVVTIAPERDRGNFVYADTEDVAATATPAWNLQDGNDLIAPGRYVLRVTAVDILHRAAPPVERLLMISRMPVDTLVPPPDTTSAARAVVTVPVGPAAGAGPGSTTRLLIGGALGIAAISLTQVAGNHSLNSGFADRSRYVVGAAVSAAALVGFFRGREHAAPAAVPQAAPPAPEDPERQDALRRIALENARRRSMAPVRIQTGGR